MHTKLMRSVWALPAVIAGFGAAGAACAQSAPGPTLSLTITARQDHVKVGDSMPLVVNATNVSDHDIPRVILNGGTLHQIRLIVSDAGGASVALTEEGKRIYGEAAGHPLVIDNAVSFPAKPGQGMREDADLAKEFDLKKPGKYTVHAEIRDGEQVVKSNEISFTLTP